LLKPVNLAILEIGRITVQGQPGQKVHNTPFQLIKAGYRGATCHPAVWGSINRKIIVQVGPDIKQQPISKITKIKIKRASSGSNACLARIEQGPEFNSQYQEKKKKKMPIQS
jgi:hypothetical protein